MSRIAFMGLLTCLSWLVEGGVQFRPLKVRKGFVHYEWFNPLEALEPMANPGEHVSEVQSER
eukprot:2482953-Amphidinium_carterae.1